MSELYDIKELPEVTFILSFSLIYCYQWCQELGTAAEQQRDGSNVGGGSLFRSVDESVGSVDGSFGGSCSSVGSGALIRREKLPVLEDSLSSYLSPH